jgi:hypothetical protein
MGFIKKILLWIAGIIFIGLGLSLIIDSFLAALSLVVASLFLIPPSTEFFYRKTTISIKPKIKLIIITVLFISAPIFIDQEMKADRAAFAAEEKERQEILKLQEKERQEALKKQEMDTIKKYLITNEDEVIRSIQSKIEIKDFSSAVLESEKYIPTGNPKILALNEIATLEMTKAQNREKSEDLLAKLKNVPVNDLHTNKLLYGQLVSINPENEKYKEKLATYTAKVAQRNEMLAKAAQREERIKAQFHPWDGSHIKLERLIKNAMNDPESYEHVDSGYIDNSDSIIVRTTYRGRNAFGGVVKNFVKAKVNLDGDILEIIDQS